jgi:hypothetical protein
LALSIFFSDMLSPFSSLRPRSASTTGARRCTASVCRERFNLGPYCRLKPSRNTVDAASATP